MKQKTTLDKIKASKRLTDLKFTLWLRDRIYPFLIFLTVIKVKYRVEALNSYAPLTDRPIIFVVNHQAFPDMPVCLRLTKRRSYILAGKQRLSFIDLIFLILSERFGWTEEARRIWLLQKTVFWQN